MQAKQGLKAHQRHTHPAPGVTETIRAVLFLYVGHYCLIAPGLLLCAQVNVCVEFFHVQEADQRVEIAPKSECELMSPQCALTSHPPPPCPG